MRFQDIFPYESNIGGVLRVTQDVSMYKIFMGAKPSHVGPVDLFNLSASYPHPRVPSSAYNGTHQVFITGSSFVQHKSLIFFLNSNQTKSKITNTTQVGGNEDEDPIEQIGNGAQGDGSQRDGFGEMRFWHDGFREMGLRGRQADV